MFKVVIIVLSFFSGSVEIIAAVVALSLLVP
jgi:hypothetical protein